MIVDNIKNIDIYAGLNKDFPKVFEYMKTLTNDTAKGPFIIDGDNVHGSVWTAETTGKAEERKLEKHEKFIDIHYLLDGTEKFGYADAESLDVVEEYHVDEDYSLLVGKSSGVILTPGHFCIVFPQDAHSPYCIAEKEETVKRCVIKIRVAD